MIIPALRRDKQSIVDYLEARRIKNSLKKDVENFYDHIDKVVEWEPMENITWFRLNLLKALKDENSIIRRNLPNLPMRKLDFLIGEIEKSEILTREIILKSIASWPMKEQRILLNFINLIYHMSGARVLNCESALPQENFLSQIFLNVELLYQIHKCF